jgi:hypothetical protein
MSHVILNGAPYTANPALGSWGDLLDEVDREIAASGTIVGSVRFDGVDEPGFREPAILIRPLEIANLDTALGPMLEAQAARDYITVADSLEFDVAPAIGPLASVIDAVRDATAAI